MRNRSVSVTAWEALFRAQVAVLRQLHVEFPTGELSLNEYDVLFNLSLQPDHTTRLRDLNRHLLLTQPSISRLVDRLVSRSLVRKDPDPDDGRGTLVCLTPEGYALFRRVAVHHVESIHRQLGVLDESELETLALLSDKLRRGVESSE